MRVLQIISSTGMYGAEAVVRSLAQELPGTGIETAVAHIRYSRPDALKLEDHLSNCDVLPIPQSMAIDPRVVSRLRREILRRDFQLLHCHGYKPDFYGEIAARLTGIPIVSTCHLWTKATRALRAYARIDGILLRHFERVVAVSEPILQELKEAGIDGRKLIYIANGISADEFANGVPSYRSLFPPHSFLFGAVGRQVAAKGIDILLQAIRLVADLVPAARLLVAGNGPRLDLHRNMSRSLGIEDRVVFMGRCEAMRDFYASLDVFVLPSLDEGLPITLLEAMASARAVIASDVGSVNSAVRDQFTGLLIPAGNTDALVSAMLSAVSNKERLVKLGAAARVQVLTRFSSQTMSERYAELYQEVCSQ